MPELRHLRYFAAVASELNFSRAAERLHISQPPLSAAIRQLEQELGVELFHRTSREVSLTEAGTAFLAGAQRTLAEMDRAVQDARRAAAGHIGRLRIACSWSARFETLPLLGRALHNSHPDVELLTQEMWNVHMASALAEGSVDVAIALCPELAAELHVERIRREPLVVLLPATHRAAQDASVPLASLARDEFVLFPRHLAPRLHDILVAVFRRAGFEPRLRAESFHAGWDLGLLADIGAGVLVPASVARGLPEGVVAVKLDDIGDELDTCLVSRADGRSPGVAACTEAARGLFA
jgi:DNA-binding transcriptional LysR family regulator